MKDRLEYLLVVALAFVLRRVPRRAARAIGRAIAWLMYRLDRRHVRIAREAVAASFPEEDAAWVRRVVRACYRHLGLSIADFARMRRITPGNVREYAVLDEDSRANSERIKADGRGAIFLTGHVGLWEYTGFCYVAHGYPLAAIARPIDNPLLSDWVDRERTRLGLRLFHKRGALVSAMRWLRDGGGVGILLDQDAGKRGIFVPFFGRLASTLPTAAELSLRTGAPVWCGTSWRDPDGLHHIVIRGPVEAPRTGDHEKDVAALTAACNAALEARVREHPEQWLWPHRRWKTRPPEEKGGG